MTLLASLVRAALRRWRRALAALGLALLVGAPPPLRAEISGATAAPVGIDALVGAFLDATEVRRTPDDPPHLFRWGHRLTVIPAGFVNPVVLDEVRVVMAELASRTGLAIDVVSQRARIDELGPERIYIFFISSRDREDVAAGLARWGVPLLQPDGPLASLPPGQICHSFSLFDIMSGLMLKSYVVMDVRFRMAGLDAIDSLGVCLRSELARTMGLLAYRPGALALERATAGAARPPDLAAFFLDTLYDPRLKPGRVDDALRLQVAAIVRDRLAAGPWRVTESAAARRTADAP